MTSRFGMAVAGIKGSRDGVLVMLGILDGSDDGIGVRGCWSAGALAAVGMLNARMALLNPIVLPGRPNCSCWVGWRRSASTSSVLLPALAIKIARLAAMTLLPSPGAALVT